MLLKKYKFKIFKQNVADSKMFFASNADVIMCGVYKLACISWFCQ